jgi:probable phosphoglycerate mutase
VAAPVIYYVRHGLTDWNAQHRLQGRHDIPLNREGRKQAIACGDILSDLLMRDGLAAPALGYVSSPLVRARETMELMRSALGLPPAGFAVDERLVEIAFGEWEGLTYDEVLARDQDVVERREGNKWTFRPPGGESYAQLTVRVGEWYRTVKTDTVVAAHGGTARALIAYLEIAPPERATHTSIDHGVVYVFANGSMATYG